jgi:hypothetical protein
VIGVSFPHGGEDGNEGDLHDHGSMWADYSLQMVHHEGGKEGCPYDHGVHGHEEFHHHRILPCEVGRMPRTQQHRGVGGRDSCKVERVPRTQQHRGVNGCGPWPDHSFVLP